jgi:diguanylate cyclase (GGDEF)-like protein
VTFRVPHQLGPSADPFRGAQHDVAIRVTGALWVVGPLMMAAFMPFYPPTAQLGAAGWVLMAVLLPTSVVMGYLAVTLRMRPGWSQLYASSFNAVAQIALVQWLAGGGDAPYLQWLLIPSLAITTQRTVLWCLPVLAFAAVTAFSPLLYSDIDVPRTAAETLLITSMAIVLSVVMTSVRRHRTELKDVGEEASALARLDTLTGLPNRRAFEETLELTVESYTEQNRPLSLLICDVDNFKEINDTFGHPAGDACLRMIADALSDGLRWPDQAFRWAGDEFAVVLHDADGPSASHAEMRLAEAMKRGAQRPDDQPITIGVGSAQLRQGMTAAQLLAAADAALLTRKAARRQAEADLESLSTALES